MDRTIEFTHLINMIETENPRIIRNRYKDIYFHFDDEISNIKKNQKLGKRK